MEEFDKEFDKMIISSDVKGYEISGKEIFKELGIPLIYGLGSFYSNEMINQGFLQKDFSFEFMTEYENLVKLWSSVEIDDNVLKRINSILDVNEDYINEYKKETLDKLIKLGFPCELVTEFEEEVYDFIKEDISIDVDKFNKIIKDVLLEYNKREDDYKENYSWNSCDYFFFILRNSLNINFDMLNNETSFNLNELNKLEHGYMNDIDLNLYLNYLNSKLMDLLNTTIEYEIVGDVLILKNLNYYDLDCVRFLNIDLSLVKNKIK